MPSFQSRNSISVIVRLAFLTSLFTILFCVTPINTVAVQLQNTKSATWLTGKKLDQAIGLAISVSWKDAPLVERLQRFSKRQKISVFVDRRIDPGTKISLAVNDVTFEQFLQVVCEKYDLEFRRIEDIYYVGPRLAATMLHVSYDEIISQLEREKPGTKAEWSRRRPLNWPRLSAPGDIIESVAKKHKLKLIGLDELPYDVWREGDLPISTVAARLSLLLVGFDRTFELTNQTREARIIKMPNRDEGIATFKIGNAKKALKYLKEQHPELNIEVKKNSIQATGTVHEIAKLGRTIALNQSAVVGKPNDSRFSLPLTTAQRGTLLASIAKQSGLELEFAPNLRRVLSASVTVDARDETIESIIALVLKGTNLKFKIETEKLIITD